MHRLAPFFAFLGLLLLINLPIVLLTLLVQFGSGLNAGAFRSAFFLIGGLLYAFSAAGTAFWLWRIYRRRSSRNGSRPLPPKRPLWWSAAYLGLLLAWSPLYNALASALGWHGIDNLANQQTLAALFAHMPLLLGVHIILFAPLAEELLFRGLFFSAFPQTGRRGTPYAALVLSSLLFAALHALPADPGFLLYFGMGGILGGAYLHTRRLRYPILIHMLNNLLGLAVWLLPQ